MMSLFWISNNKVQNPRLRQEYASRHRFSGLFHLQIRHIDFEIYLGLLDLVYCTIFS